MSICHIVAMAMHDFTLTDQVSVVNIADLRSAFVITLASERFRRNAVDGEGGLLC